ncbi:MAG: M20 aminoacylase family protein [Hyphomicrobiales bacterium]|jgi:amidohydrolase
MSAPLTIDAKELAMLVALRHDLHAHPELGFEEERTAQLVADKLSDAGIAVDRGLGKTGIVGTLTVGSGSGHIALRADMDALAMPETGNPPYKSMQPGKMHACGHDGHTVMLLGAARHLAKSRNFSGTVHFIFQPAEEGRGGAKAMIDDGFLAKFPVERVYGLHNMPGLDPDEMAVVSGPQLASSDSWEVTFTGVGTHGAKPHLGRDPISAAGQFLSSIHSIVARIVDPLEPAVVSACAVEAGDFKALNVIPNTARVAGTARAYSARVRDQLEVEIGSIAHGIAQAFGVTASYQFTRRIPPVVNDADTTERALTAARSALGEARIRTTFPPSTAGDDFAFFSQDVPGCYVWLGNGPAVDGALHHNTGYDFNDAAIIPGIAFWTRLVEMELAA